MCTEVEPSRKKRKMEPHLGGDNCRLGGDLSPNPSRSLPSGSASGDFIQESLSNHVAFVNNDGESDESATVIKQSCELCGEWVHKYPLPLSYFPVKSIKTGSAKYDAVITDLSELGYRALQIVAKGRSGTIVLAQDMSKNKYDGEHEYVPVAIKFNSARGHRKNRQCWRTDMTHEMNILKEISHPSVVTWCQNIDYKGCLGVVMEFCPNGNLDQLLRLKNASFLPERVCRIYFRQMLDGIEYIHGQGIAHRDICTYNMLITQNNTIKISDFGHACRFMTGDELRTDQCGTSGFISPEILLNQPYNPKFSDIWSFGVILYYMTTGRFPFGILQTDIIARSGKVLNFPEKRIFPIASTLKELLSGMLAHDPYRRHTSNRIRFNSWVTTVDNRVQVGNFYLVRHPRKIKETQKERLIKELLEI